MVFIKKNTHEKLVGPRRGLTIFAVFKNQSTMSQETQGHYQSTAVEEKWYQHWEDAGYFQSTPDEREPYAIVIPPPNVTGVLHMGHMLNNTIQDVLIRHARQNGKNACWVPGTDHASIATEAKVVKWLREEKNLTKGDLGREEFLKYAWQWKEKYGGIILKQLRKLGASCDWSRTAFTMDETRTRMVLQAFVDLYNDGKLYRDWRMVNWDPQAKTVLSNEEVLYNEENGGLHYVKYVLADGSGQITIATTRPETILADSAVAVHPEDERYQHFIGKEVIVPIINRKVPVIADDYVDCEFGTGALKITPAHDPNDYEIGQRHKLEIIDMFTDDGKLNEKAVHFVGQDRFEARVSMKKALSEAELLVKVEDHRHKVGRSERTNAVVEPKLSLQWYVDMPELAKPALDAVLSGEVNFVPKNQENLYRHWMENIRDWCISRQLWWGQRIPAFCYKEETFVAVTVEEALEMAQAQFPEDNVAKDDLRQDEDVLDTWFSSWLWPYSVFMKPDGDTSEIDYYYPTSTLVTGWDIIFLWVARMIMAGYQWKHERPFADVYFTGMVRDKQRRKMSKSLGNSPDALMLIDKYGADGVRFGMLSCSPAGGDLLFDEKLCEQGSKFCNKLWNAMKLIKSFERTGYAPLAKDELAIAWIKNKINQEISEIESQFKSYRLSEALIKLYSLIWSDFCSWYLEMIKPADRKSISGKTLDETVRIFERLMSLLHPFMPFVTEEIWHQLADRTEGDDCMMSSYPAAEAVDKDVIDAIEHLKTTVSMIRDLRNKNGIKERESLELKAEKGSKIASLFAKEGYLTLLENMAYVTDVEAVEAAPANAQAFIVDTEKFFLLTGDLINVEEEIERLEGELEYVKGFIFKTDKKLSNERFVQNAPAAVVEKERKKLQDGQERLRIIEDSLKSLRG